jgi:hypothetical protein
MMNMYNISNNLYIYALICILFSANVDARSMAVRQQFKNLYPCPSTGQSKGRCHGWIIDHIEALACGGSDSVSNMQWQRTEDAKAKDKWERIGCKGGKKIASQGNVKINK